MQPCTDTGLKTKSEDFLPTDQSSRYSILKVILLGKQRYNTRKYGTALQFAFTVLRDNTRSHFNFLVNLQKQNKTKGVSISDFYQPTYETTSICIQSRAPVTITYTTSFLEPYKTGTVFFRTKSSELSSVLIVLVLLVTDCLLFVLIGI